MVREGNWCCTEDVGDDVAAGVDMAMHTVVVDEGLAGCLLDVGR